MTFGHTNPQKIILVLTAVLGWLMVGRSMRGQMGRWDWLSLFSGLGAFLYACYLAIANMPASTFGGH